MAGSPTGWAAGGDLPGCTAAYQALLADQTRLFGTDDPRTLLTRNTVALCLAEAGDPATADEMLRTLLADHVRVLGPAHPGTRVVRDNFLRAGYGRSP